MINTKISDSIFVRWLALIAAFGGLWFLWKNKITITANSPKIIGNIVSYIPREDFLLCIFVASSVTLFLWRKPFTPQVIFWKCLSHSMLIAQLICVMYVWFTPATIHAYTFFLFPISWFLGFNICKGIYQSYGSGEGQGKEVLKRGKTFLTLDEARVISETKIMFDSPGVRFGWLTVPESQATTHFAIVGATGSGKTILTRALMESVLPRIGSGQDSRALIYDAKRDMLPILVGMGLKDRVVSLHPFDKRGASWDIAKDIVSPASADQTATILIPHERGSSNPFFTDAARALMTGVMTVFIRKCPDVWTFRDVIVALKSATRIKMVISQCDETRDLIEQYFTNERTSNDVMSTIATKIQRYQYVAAAWEKAEHSFSLRDWIREEKIVVLGNDEEARSAVDALNQVIFKRATEVILNSSESFTRRTWVILDELKEAGELPGLGSLLSKGRSKGACVVLGFQDMEGLSAAMKDTRVAHEIVGLCANKAILRLDSPETARWASSLFGDQEIEQLKVSSSSGSSEQGGHKSFLGNGSKSVNNSTSESWVNLKRQSILPGQFLDLLPVEKSGCLHGYYIVPSVGTYGASIRMSGEDSILEGMHKVSEDTPGYLERPKEEQYLRLWDEADLKRLHLQSVKTDDGFIRKQEISEEISLAGEDISPLDQITRK